MHAVLKAEEIMAIPTSAGPTYKTSSENPNWRHRIDANETLKQFDARFAAGELFVTESEICEQFLIPEGEDLSWDGTGELVRRYWEKHKLSGDNTLERPYAGLYPRLTTRSNHFRVHLWIQTLKKSTETPIDTFVQGQDRVTSNYRGSTLLERVLDLEKAAAHNYLRDLAHRLPRLETCCRSRAVRSELFHR